MSHIEIDDIPAAPPALLLMLQEFACGRDWSEIRKRIRAALRDMREQSLAFEMQNVSRAEPSSALRFEIHPHGALDLLSGHGSSQWNAGSPLPNDWLEALALSLTAYG
jgi:hypothetical protein